MYTTDSRQSSVIACDVTLFIRLLEVAREELKTDEALHQLVERCSELAAVKGSPLTMDDYDRLHGHDKPEKSMAGVLAAVRRRLKGR